jgi:hypothetical protein
MPAWRREFYSEVSDELGLSPVYGPINKCCSVPARASLLSLSRARSHSVQPGVGFWQGLALPMHPLTVAMAAMAVTITNNLLINRSRLPQKTTFRLGNCFIGVLKTSQTAIYSIVPRTISNKLRYFASMFESLFRSSPAL